MRPRNDWKVNSNCGRVQIIRHLGPLYRYAIILTENPDDAEDLVQETCTRAMKSKSLEDLAQSVNLKKWLLIILRNTWINELRSRRRESKFVKSDCEDNDSVTVRNTLKDIDACYATKFDVRDAIQKLSPSYREVILLREFEEMSYREMASILNCPIGTIMSRLARARGELRTMLGYKLGRQACE